MEQGVLSNKKFGEFINENAIPLFAHYEEKHGTVETVDPRTKEKSTRCKLFSNLTCEQHKKIYQDAGNKFEFSGVPTSFVLKADGTEFKKIGGPSNNKEIEDAVKAAQKELGQGLPYSKYMGFVASLQKGDALLEGDKPDYQKAIAEYNKVASMKGKIPGTLTEEAEKRLEKVNELGQAKLTEAKDKIES
ncbi:MAG: hypothetical protein RDV41_12510, partial [Planctomycetota bacterium]|nr:hypothetical protein [Planctomycetota bacterium]